MKNIYELKREEKDKYREEFNNLKFTKDINVMRGPALFISFLGFLGAGFIDGLISEGEKINQTLVNGVWGIAILACIVFVILEVYLKITFTRWMKIKHDVEY